MKKFLSIASIATTSIALSLTSIQQARAIEFVTNGGFAQNNATAASAYLGNTNNDVTVTGWDFGLIKGDSPSHPDNGYNFLVSDGTTLFTNAAAQGNAPYGGLTLYGNPGQTVNSADGSGWYIAADGWYDNASISQNLTGLTVGDTYTLTFSQAYGQQTGFVGDETMFFKVGFGGSTQNSTTMNITSAQPVSGWNQQTMSFVADDTTQLLSFLASGTRDVPPFALLSGVSVQGNNTAAVPEPEDYIGTLMGMGFVGTLVKSRLAKKKLADKD
jgi:Protein of unknown function (DUF642)